MDTQVAPAETLLAESSHVGKARVKVTKKKKVPIVDKKNKKIGHALLSSLPKYKLIELYKINVESQDIISNIHTMFRYISTNAPSVKKQALPYLELVEPLIVVKLEPKDEYQLLAGHRTLQLLLEQYNRSDKCLVTVLSPQDKNVKNKFSAIDGIVKKIIQRPDGKDIALIASELVDNKELNQEVNEFLPVKTHAEICQTLGVERTNLHKMAVSIRKLKTDGKTETKDTAKGKTDLGINEEAQNE